MVLTFLKSDDLFLDPLWWAEKQDSKKTKNHKERCAEKLSVARLKLLNNKPSLQTMSVSTSKYHFVPIFPHFGYYGSLNRNDTLTVSFSACNLLIWDFCRSTVATAGPASPDCCGVV